jgi:hypothetical protein
MPHWNDEDFFVLFRSIFSSADYRSLPSGDSRQVMIAILSEAQWAARKLACTKCGAPVTLACGDVWFTMSGLADQAVTTRDVVRTALRRLTKTGFLRQLKWCKHRLVYRLVNRAKFDKLLKGSHSCPTAEPQLPHSTPTDAPQLSHGKEDVKDVKEDTTIPELPDTNPNSPFVAVADEIRALMLKAGCKCPGYKNPTKYRANHRLSLTNAVRHVAESLEIPPDKQRELVTWALLEAPTWTKNGVTQSWPSLMDKPDPGAAWRRYAPGIDRSRDFQSRKPKQRHKLEKYSPSPAAPYQYYCDDEQISREKYNQLVREQGGE